METKVEEAANEIKRLKGLYQQSDQRSGASRHLESRPEAVMVGQNRGERIAMSDLSARPAAGGIFGYGLSVVLVALSTGLTLLLQDYTFRTPLFLPAILLSTWFGGTGPGLLAVVLSTLSINFFILEPKFAFSFSFRDAVHLVVFLFSALLISSWSAARRRVEHALKSARAELEEKVEARTADLSRINEQLRQEIAERERSEGVLREKASLLNLTHDTVFVRDMNDVITYWNRGAEERYGWSSQEAVGRVSHELTQTSFPAPLQEINAKLLKTGQWDGELIHTRRDGTTVTVASRWALQRDETQKPIAILETNNDITEHKRGQALFTGEKRLLEMIATGVALEEILNVLCLIIEEYRSGTLASILLLRPDGLHLDSVAGPSLPKGWRQEMEKLPIGPCAGSCGTAAYRGSPVMVSDIATDPLWEVPEHRAAALSHGLRASWSNPILSSDGRVLGTFCIYGREPQSPSAHDLGVMEKATHLARVAIERDRAEAAVRTSEEKYRDLINASPDAICVIDADAKYVLVNPAGVKLAGRPEHELIGSSIADT